MMTSSSLEKKFYNDNTKEVSLIMMTQKVQMEPKSFHNDETEGSLMM